MTKWLLALVLTLVLIAGTQVTAAAQRDRAQQGTRTIEVPYQNGAVQFVACFECPTTRSRQGERFVSVEVVDETSPVGYVDVYWEAGGEEHFFSVCGATEQPEPIPPNTEFTIFPWRIPDPACPTGFTTSGTVVLTFARKAG